MEKFQSPWLHGGGTTAHPYWIREPDGSRFGGTIKLKRIKRKTQYGSFVRAFVDSKGRWFDNAGMPMSKPADEVEDEPS